MQLSAPIYQLKRQAKLRAREKSIPLNKALNHIAQQEGFASWSLLASKVIRDLNPAEILSAIRPGELILLGARPGHGKTLLGLKIIAETIKSGNRAAFFSLEYSVKDILEQFRNIGEESLAHSEELQVDVSDDISADHIIKQIEANERPKVVVIDYLQLLDQQRDKPVLIKQIDRLKVYAKASGVSFILISQIDRSYDLSPKNLPELSDIRLPNPIDLNSFDKACFLHNGKLQIKTIN